MGLNPTQRNNAYIYNWGSQGIKGIFRKFLADLELNLAFPGL